MNDDADRINIALREKQRDYRRVVITQAIIIIVALLLEDVVNLFGFDNERRIFFSAFLLLGGFYYYMLWDLLRNFDQRRKVRRAILFILIANLVLLAYAEFPFAVLVSDPRPFLIVIHSVLFCTEVYVMFFVFKDIFGTAMARDKIWGSVCLFLMMSIAFASIYDLVNLVSPNSFGVMLQPGFPTFVESLYFSLVTIGGGSPAFPAISHLVRNIAAIESVWGTLYLVILIGRIIGSK